MFVHSVIGSLIFSSPTAGDVAFVAMEPTLSTIYWGICTDHITSGMLESALMYFKPREVLASGHISSEMNRLLTAFIDTSQGTAQEAVPDAGQERTALLQVSSSSAAPMCQKRGSKLYCSACSTVLFMSICRACSHNFFSDPA